MTRIKRNSIVTMHHRLGLTDGTVLEDSFEQEPVTFHLGTGELAEGLELALLDLQEGDEQTLDIGPDLAFGYADETSVHSIKRSEFAADCELQPGLILEFSMPNGESLPGTILEFDHNMVKVDFNHPLAGQTVRFAVKIIKVEDPASAEVH